jgi:Sigma-70, region 4
MVRLSRRSMGEYRGCSVLVIICAKKRTKKRSRWLAETLAKLHPAHRYVITSAYFRRQSITEIATRLGIPESDVRSRLHYGLRTFKALVDERGGELRSKGAVGVYPTERTAGGCRVEELPR